jgi:preprotein translocase subunit YajC
MQQILYVVVMYAAIFAVFYFLFIKPQKKKEQKLKDMRNSLVVGDKVTTVGGIIAHVAKVEDDCVTLELGPNRAKVPFEKWAIASVEAKKSDVE